MRILFVLISLLLYYSHSATAQSFEGRLEYISFFLDKATFKPLFEGKPETVTKKGGMVKVNVLEAQGGQLDWQVDNYVTGVTHYRKSYRNTEYLVTDKPPTRGEDGKLIFQKPDSPLVAPILRTTPWLRGKSPVRQMKYLDTTFNIHGYDCSVIIEYTDNIKTAEYYCHAGIRMDSSLYQCSRKDGLDHIYRFTGGQLIVQWVAFDNLYTLVYQLQKVHNMRIDEKEFEIPGGIPIKDEVQVPRLLAVATDKANPA